jgi:hypothetical protein
MPSFTQLLFYSHIPINVLDLMGEICNINNLSNAIPSNITANEARDRGSKLKDLSILKLEKAKKFNQLYYAVNILIDEKSLLEKLNDITDPDTKKIINMDVDIKTVPDANFRNQLESMKTLMDKKIFNFLYYLTTIEQPNKDTKDSSHTGGGEPKIAGPITTALGLIAAGTGVAAVTLGCLICAIACVICFTLAINLNTPKTPEPKLIYTRSY